RWSDAVVHPELGVADFIGRARECAHVHAGFTFRDVPQLAASLTLGALLIHLVYIDGHVTPLWRLVVASCSWRLCKRSCAHDAPRTVPALARCCGPRARSLILA